MTGKVSRRRGEAEDGSICVDFDVARGAVHVKTSDCLRHRFKRQAANGATGISRKRDVFQLDDNGAPDADTSDAVGWNRDDGMGYGILYWI